MDSLSTRTGRVRTATDQFRTSLRDALSGPRGGHNRRRILHALLDRPRNANRLATDLRLDYKTVRHHLSVLGEMGAVTRGGGYGGVYVPTPAVRTHRDLLEAVADTDAIGDR